MLGDPARSLASTDSLYGWIDPGVTFAVLSFTKCKRWEHAMATLDSRYLESLKGIPGVVSYRVLEPSTSSRGGAPDATLELRTSAGAHRLVMRQFRSHLSREMAEHAVGTVNEGKRPVLILAPHVGAGLSEVFIAGGVNYLDAAGNCVHFRTSARTRARRPVKEDGAVPTARPSVYGYQHRVAHRVELGRRGCSPLRQVPAPPVPGLIRRPSVAAFHGFEGTQ